MKLIYSDEFKKQFYKLPLEIQNLYRRQEKIMKQNWRDPRLHVKKLKEQPYPFSFRITRRYRVFFTLVKDNTILLATVGHRRDIYR